MIETEIGVARSTLSGWLRNVPVTDKHSAIHKARWEAAQRMAIQANTLRREAQQADIQAKAGQDIRDLFVDGASKRDLFIIGLMLYWAEGAKTGSVVSVTNSDPFVIKAFVLWLEQCLDVSRAQLRGEVHIYPDIDVNEAESYWSEVIGISRTQFYKAQVDRRTNKSVDKHGKLRYGTVHVKALGQGSTKNLRKILAWISHLHGIIDDATRE